MEEPVNPMKDSPGRGRLLHDRLLPPSAAAAPEEKGEKSGEMPRLGEKTSEEAREVRQGGRGRS